MKLVKRFIPLLLIALLLLAILPCETYASPPQDDPTHKHSWKVIENKAPTCTKGGKKTWECTRCGKKHTEKSRPLGHDPQPVAGKAPTCTDTGLTDGVVCGRCGEVITPQETIPALGHQPQTIPGKSPTCTETGLTDGQKCTRCGAVLKAQETIPALGHQPQTIPGKSPTCTETGLTDGQKCTRCGSVLKAQETIPALGHQPQTIPGKSPTCTEAGLTDGQKCTRCGAVLKAQESMPALGHQPATIPGKAATCTETGLTDGQKCTRCGAVLKAQETIPALGHQPQTIPGKSSTCTETGLTDGQKCTRCGAVLKAQETIPALGHDWDEGTVTVPPWLLTPGERTFTCKRDPRHTRTEEIPPSADAIFSSIGTGSWTLANITPLTVTEQPVGGSIIRYGDEKHHLTCAVTGGTVPYTYEWYSISTVPLSKTGWNWPSGYGEQSEPGFDAESGDRKYYCRITDAAGDTVSTEYANVTYKISIAKQPDNANLQPTGKATLTCEAVDGSGSYSYRWIDDQGHEIDVGSSIDVTEIGDYMCIATDDLTGETVNSEMCTVYDVEPFRLVNITPDCELWPEETCMLEASFTGGVEDYEIWWDKNGTAIDSVEDRDELDNVHSRANVDGPGKYTVHGVDSMYATASGSVTVTVPKLTIVEQPVGGVIPKDGVVNLYVQVGDGEGPYYYTLYRNGQEHVKGDSQSAVRYSFRVWYPGEYYFHIEDSKGRQVDSDVVTCEDAVFRIKRQSNAGVLYTETDTFTLSVEVEGGKEPYTYEWMQYRGNTPWYVTASTTATCTAGQPGVYVCRITDATGETIRTKDIHVHYSGQKPRIIKQPSDLTVTPDEKGHFSFSLSCEAASGNGDESCLEYRWERYDLGGYWSYAGSEKTMTHSLLGSYRCKVIDVISKEYTYTKTVTVAEKVTASVNAQSIPNSSYLACYFNITGGTAPYTVKVYVEYPAYHTETGVEPSKTVLWRTYMFNTEAETKDFYREVPHTYSYPYYEDGQWKYGWGYLNSYAIITDAGGRTTRVDIK